MLRIRAGRVEPVTAPSITDGAVLVVGSRIAAIGPDAAVAHPSEAEALAFPDATLVPGLVNCHTHLELTHLAGRNGEAEFANWVRRVRELKDATPNGQFDAAAERGIRDGWTRGVTCVAETGSTGAVMAALARLGGRGVVYQEVFGPDASRCRESMVALEAAIVRLNPLVSDRVRLGLSPHAPYTVSAVLYRSVAELARLERLPLAVHVAESVAETELVRFGTGPFAAHLRDRGIAVAGQGTSPIGYLASLGVLDAGSAGGRAGTLCIHCVHADAGDIRTLQDAGAAIATCPRSNQAHGHGAAPLAAFRAAGLRVGFGTDSVVSVPDLDLWAEAASAGLRGDAALRALTLGAAQTLGWDDEIGSLAVGKAADLAVLETPPAGAVAAPACLLTVVAGRIVHRRDAGTGAPR